MRRTSVEILPVSVPANGSLLATRDSGAQSIHAAVLDKRVEVSVVFSSVGFSVD